MNGQLRPEDGIRISTINNYVAYCIERNKETLRRNKEKYGYYFAYHKALIEAGKQADNLGLVGKILRIFIDKKIVRAKNILNEIFDMPAYSLHYFCPETQTKSEEKQ